MLRTERLLSSLATVEDDEINEPEVDLKNKHEWKGMNAGKKKHYMENFKDRLMKLLGIPGGYG